MRSNVVTALSPGNVEPVDKPTMGYTAGQALYIHPSSVVRLVGLEYPDMETAPDAWGDSALQPVQDAIKAAGMVSGSIATMISEAKVDVIKIPGLLNMLSTDSGTKEITDRFSNANVAKSIINALLLDKTDEWERMELHLTGYDKVMAMYLSMCAGAADIPETRLLGRSPAGMNSTGESDMRNYYVVRVFRTHQKDTTYQSCT
jgi:uncharacterized protein